MASIAKAAYAMLEKGKGESEDEDDSPAKGSGDMKLEALLQRYESAHGEPQKRAAAFREAVRCAMED